MAPGEVDQALTQLVEEHRARTGAAALAGEGLGAPPLRSSPPARAAVPSLFQSEGRRAELTDAQIQSLLAAIGGGPNRLRDRPSKTGALESRVAALLTPAPATAEEAEEWDEALEDVPAPSMDPMQELLRQNRQLLEHLCRPKASSDPFGILQTSTEPAPAADVSSSSGSLRGFLRRSQWIELLDSAAAEPAVSAQVRAGLGRTLSIAADSLPSTAMERYFTEVSPLSRHPLLTYMACIAAAMWRAREEGNRARLDLLVSSLPVFLDQTAIEGGRAQTAYLFTGLPDPLWSRVALNTTVAWHQPNTPLADVRWVGA